MAESGTSDVRPVGGVKPDAVSASLGGEVLPTKTPTEETQTLLGAVAAYLISAEASDWFVGEVQRRLLELITRGPIEAQSFATLVGAAAVSQLPARTDPGSGSDAVLSLDDETPPTDQWNGDSSTEKSLSIKKVSAALGLTSRKDHPNYNIIAFLRRHDLPIPPRTVSGKFHVKYVYTEEWLQSVLNSPNFERKKSLRGKIDDILSAFKDESGSYEVDLGMAMTVIYPLIEQQYNPGRFNSLLNASEAVKRIEAIYEANSFSGAAKTIKGCRGTALSKWFGRFSDIFYQVVNKLGENELPELYQAELAKRSATEPVKPPTPADVAKRSANKSKSSKPPESPLAPKPADPISTTPEKPATSYPPASDNESDKSPSLTSAPISTSRNPESKPDVSFETGHDQLAGLSDLAKQILTAKKPVDWIGYAQQFLSEKLGDDFKIIWNQIGFEANVAPNPEKLKSALGRLQTEFVNKGDGWLDGQPQLQLGLRLLTAVFATKDFTEIAAGMQQKYPDGFDGLADGQKRQKVEQYLAAGLVELLSDGN
ncbi:MAG: hypothetical protein LBM73_03565 [Candidatus Nomurabacteria bacterium]|jgi:hypothetical protein|nr:hypothetical protein [Candidatus Nomurabacteria bacterium]